MIVIVMGVSGSGKTTIGSRLAAALGCAFLEGDALHSPGNIAKMRRGIPLTDEDRRPWLAAIRSRLVTAADRGEDLVAACSALRRSYRETLAHGLPVTWVYLKGSRDLILSRVRQRSGHFAGPDIVEGQFDALEEPSDALVADVAFPPESIVRQILAQLRPRLEGRKTSMQIAMIGLGRMGGNMVRRLLRGGHACVVFDAQPSTLGAFTREGAAGAASLEDLVRQLAPPRIVWLMLPASVVDGTLTSLSSRLEPGDVVIDGGNSHYVDDIRRAATLRPRGIHYVDVGVSGGVWGLDRGYCLMIGGDAAPVAQLDPIFRSLAPGAPAAGRTPGRDGRKTTAEEGYLHCGPAGAGHFVKMVHNGIEYGLMAAYAEGFNLLAHAGAGAEGRVADAETAPLPHPEHFRYDFPLADIAEVWRRGSVVGSWLLDLTAAALAGDEDLKQFAGRVSDSGEGRWAAQAALESSTPMPVLAAALFQRFVSRGEDDFARRLLSAMRHQFGGHVEK